MNHKFLVNRNENKYKNEGNFQPGSIKTKSFLNTTLNYQQKTHTPPATKLSLPVFVFCLGMATATFPSILKNCNSDSQEHKIRNIKQLKSTNNISRQQELPSQLSGLALFLDLFKLKRAGSFTFSDFKTDMTYFPVCACLF